MSMKSRHKDHRHYILYTDYNCQDLTEKGVKSVSAS